MKRELLKLPDYARKCANLAKNIDALETARIRENRLSSGVRQIILILIPPVTSKKLGALESRIIPGQGDTSDWDEVVTRYP